MPGTVTISPQSGPPGSQVGVSGSVTCQADTQTIALVQNGTTLVSTSTNDGSFSVELSVPDTASTGPAQVNSTCDGSSATLGTFSVTGPETTTTTTPPTTTTTTAPTTTTPPPPPSRSQLCPSDSGNSGYVCSLYVDLLGRLPDAGSQSWIAALDSGRLNRTQVANGILSTPEFLHGEIAAWYTGYLGRPVDSLGLAAWIAVLAHGTPNEVVQAELLGSPEFYALAGSTPSGFVDRLYHDVLGRPADSASSVFQTLVADGQQHDPQGAQTVRTYVAVLILGSAEYQTDLVNFFYEQFLNRAADPGGLAGFVGVLQKGGTDQAVIDAILTSSEFFPNT
jgi:hypothetical protein